MRTVFVPLSQGKVATIDECDADRVLAFRWYALNTGRGKIYAVRNVRRPDGRRTIQYLHSFIMDAPRGVEVDHRNGDGLRCTRDNLRIAAHAQNTINVGKGVRNTSGFLGVTWDSRRSSWVAQIQHQGKHIHIGRFNTREEAAVARSRVAHAMHGDFASHDELAA